MSGRTFVLVVVDRGTGEFTVEGPMSDDWPWGSAVLDAQKAGRNVHCFSLGDVSPDTAAIEWQERHFDTRVAAGSIVCPTLGEAACSDGPLLPSTILKITDAATD